MGAQLKWGRQLIIWPIIKFLYIPVGCVPPTAVAAIRCVDPPPPPPDTDPLDRDPQKEHGTRHRYIEQPDRM